MLIVRGQKRDERLSAQIANNAVRQAAAAAGMTHQNDLSSNDVLVVGYPKSGNTWLQIMLAAIVFGLEIEQTPFSLMCEAVPDLSDREYFRRHSSTMFFKSHALPCEHYRKVVYLLRDGRDVMVSYRHFREVMDKRKYELERFAAPETALWPCHWHQHVDAWEANPFGADMIFVRYEDMVASPAKELQRILSFARINRPDAHIEQIVGKATIGRLRQKEINEGAIPVPAYNGLTPFFRRGKVGSHRDEMSPEALKAFLSHARPTLERCGYMLHDNPVARALARVA